MTDDADLEHESEDAPEMFPSELLSDDEMTVVDTPDKEFADG